MTQPERAPAIVNEDYSHETPSATHIYTKIDVIRRRFAFKVSTGDVRLTQTLALCFWVLIPCLIMAAAAYVAVGASFAGWVVIATCPVSSLAGYRFITRRKR